MVIIKTNVRMEEVIVVYLSEGTCENLFDYMVNISSK